MSVAFVTCPRCRRALRVPQLKDAAALATALQDAEGGTAVELRCRWYGATFPLGEALEEER